MVAEIADLADPQHDRSQKSSEDTEQLRGRDLFEIPWADCMLHRLKHRVLADARSAAEHQAVVYLIVRALHAVCEVQNNALMILRINTLDEFKPPACLFCVAVLERRRTIQIERRDFVTIYPAAVDDELVANERRLPGCPGEMVHRPF